MTIVKRGEKESVADLVPGEDGVFRLRKDKDVEQTSSRQLLAARLHCASAGLAPPTRLELRSWVPTGWHLPSNHSPLHALKVGMDLYEY